MADTCPHGLDQPIAGPLTACPSCLDGAPVVVAGHLVWCDDDGVVWLPLHRITLVRVASDDATATYLDVSVAHGDEPGTERPHDETSTWWRIGVVDPHAVARAIALERWHR